MHFRHHSDPCWKLTSIIGHWHCLLQFSSLLCINWNKISHSQSGFVPLETKLINTFQRHSSKGPLPSACGLFTLAVITAIISAANLPVPTISTVTLHADVYVHMHIYMHTQHIQVYEHMHTHITYVHDRHKELVSSRICLAAFFWVLQASYRSFPVTKNLFYNNHLFDS